MANLAITRTESGIQAGASLSLGQVVYFKQLTADEKRILLRENWFQNTRRYIRDTWRWLRAVNWSADNWREQSEAWWGTHHDSVYMPLSATEAGFRSIAGLALQSTDAFERLSVAVAGTVTNVNAFNDSWYVVND